MDAARDLLHAGGYEAVGVDDICERADVRKGSFYYFFPSKQDLAHAALDNMLERGRAGFMDAAFSSDAPPLERVRVFFDNLAEGNVSMQKATGVCGGCMFGNLAAEMGSRDERIQAKVQGMFDHLAEAFTKTLREAVRNGDVKNIDPVVNARALVAYMEGILLLAKNANDAKLLRALAPNAMALATAPKASRRR